MAGVRLPCFVSWRAGFLVVFHQNREHQTFNGPVVQRDAHVLDDHLDDGSESGVVRSSRACTASHRRCAGSVLLTGSPGSNHSVHCRYHCSKMFMPVPPRWTLKVSVPRDSTDSTSGMGPSTPDSVSLPQEQPADLRRDPEPSEGPGMSAKVPSDALVTGLSEPAPHRALRLSQCIRH